MKTCFRLLWLKPGKAPARAFKLPGTQELFTEYTERIHPFTAVTVSGPWTANVKNPAGEARLWVCDRGPTAKVMSSEQLADKLRTCLDDGVGNLEIVIGGPDGFPPGELDRLKPALRWSFGSLTLPHELAAVIAAEQIYRAWTILKKHPYHSGH